MFTHSSSTTLSQEFFFPISELQMRSAMASHCFGLAPRIYHNQFIQILTKSTHLPTPPFYLCSNPENSKASDLKNEILPFMVVSKRMVTISMGALLLADPLSRFSKAMADEVLELERYTDDKEGFTLLRPSSWTKVDKAGATVLFQDVNKGSNNVGVVVSPVRISKLSEFGSPQFVADKLIETEKRKESTKAAEVVAVEERSGQGGLQVYEFEYKLDSTRGGMKRVYSAAFVASKKLYLLNISHSDGLENPLDSDTRMVLEQVVHSFDVSPVT